MGPCRGLWLGSILHYCGIVLSTKCLLSHLGLMAQPSSAWAVPRLLLDANPHRVADCSRGALILIL